MFLPGKNIYWVKTLLTFTCFGIKIFNLTSKFLPHPNHYGHLTRFILLHMFSNRCARLTDQGVCSPALNFGTPRHDVLKYVGYYSDDPTA